MKNFIQKLVKLLPLKLKRKVNKGLRAIGLLPKTTRRVKKGVSGSTASSNS